MGNGCEMWELDHKEGWVLKNWCFWTVVLKKSLESPLDCKEIKPVNPKGYQLWIFIGGTDAKAEAPILWPPDAKSWLIGKDPDAGKDWRQEKNGMAEDEMFGWYHQLEGHEFEQVLGDGEGQESLACYSPWGHNELDTTEWLNSNSGKRLTMGVGKTRFQMWTLPFMNCGEYTSWPHLQYAINSRDTNSGSGREIQTSWLV